MVGKFWPCTCCADPGDPISCGDAEAIQAFHACLSTHDWHVQLPEFQLWPRSFAPFEAASGAAIVLKAPNAFAEFTGQTELLSWFNCPEGTGRIGNLADRTLRAGIGAMCLDYGDHSEYWAVFNLAANGGEGYIGQQWGMPITGSTGCGSLTFSCSWPLGSCNRPWHVASKVGEHCWEWIDAPLPGYTFPGSITATAQTPA